VCLAKTLKLVLDRGDLLNLAVCLVVRLRLTVFRFQLINM
jgi:hypothetical protein